MVVPPQAQEGDGGQGQKEQEALQGQAAGDPAGVFAEIRPQHVQVIEPRQLMKKLGRGVLEREGGDDRQVRRGGQQEAGVGAARQSLYCGLQKGQRRRQR